MIKALIFDVFGVLYPDTYKEFIAKYGAQLPLSQQAELRDIHQRSNRGQISISDAIVAMSDLTGQDTQTIHRELYEEEHINTDLIELIAGLKKSYKIGILSNVGAGFIEDFFAQHDLGQYFDAVTLSCDMGYVKPERQSYELAAKALTEPVGDCLMIDDKRRNIDGAKAIGMPGLLYEDFPQFQKELTMYLNDAFLK
jgi:HAD superfamily hydrolase (TIGR01509 family)